MSEGEWLAGQFEENRSRPRAVACGRRGSETDGVGEVRADPEDAAETRGGTHGPGSACVLNGQSRPVYLYERRRGAKTNGDVECGGLEVLLCPGAQFSIADRSSRLRRSGSARMSISTILPLPIVKPSTANGLPSGRRDTTPTLPFTRTT